MILIDIIVICNCLGGQYQGGGLEHWDQGTPMHHNLFPELELGLGVARWRPLKVMAELLPETYHNFRGYGLNVVWLELENGPSQRFHSYGKGPYWGNNFMFTYCRLTLVKHSVLNVRGLVGAFNQEKAIVGVFSVIAKLKFCEGSFPALLLWSECDVTGKYSLDWKYFHIFSWLKFNTMSTKWTLTQ